MISTTEAVPVIIPARNEARDIAGAVSSLLKSAEPVLPIVVANGCKDETAAIAEQAGAIVLESGLGKVEATKVGLEYVVSHLGSTMVLFTDADTRVGRYWSRIMQKSVTENDHGFGVLATGGVRFFGEPGRTTNLVRSLNMIATDVKRTVSASAVVPVRGYNYGIKFDKSCTIFKAILGLDGSIFPGADAAIVDAVQRAGADVVFEPHPLANVKTRGDRIDSLLQEVRYRLFEKAHMPPGAKFLTSYQDEYGSINPYSRNYN